MIDFDRLCLVPAQQTFGKPCVLTPLKSQPDNPVPYVMRGIFTSRAYDVAMQDGSIFSDQQTTLGIRLAEFDVVPARGDTILLNGINYWILDIDYDGQGGGLLSLRLTPP
jgi:hypothetical protein